MNFSGAIFDVDGTLLDSMHIWMTVGTKYMASLGIEPEEGLNEKLFSMTMKTGAVYLKEQYHLEKSPQQIIGEINEIVRDFYWNEAPMKPGAAGMLQWLQRQGIPMAVATATDEPLIRGAFKRLGILSYFREIFTCSKVGEGKENSLIYLKAAQCLGSEPRETLVFEDALYALTTAKKAGFITLGVYDVHSEADQPRVREQADLYGHDLSEILEQLQNKDCGSAKRGTDTAEWRCL